MIKVQVTSDDEKYIIKSKINDTPKEIIKQLSLINSTVIKQICRDTGLSIYYVLSLYKISIQEAIDKLLAH